jgi:hypothetical protein
MEQPEEEECKVCGKMVVVDEDCDCCDECGGSGRHMTTREDAPMKLVDIGPCPECIKHGRIDE